MRTTLDIPDPVYRDLKSKAAREGRPLKALLLEKITRDDVVRPPLPTGKMRFPAIESKNPGSLKLGPEGVYEYIPFP